MRSARESAIRLLQLMMAASVVLPVLLFLVAAALNYRYQQAVADDRIERSLDIVHENALKVFQTGERAIAEVEEVIRGMTDEAIAANQLQLHERLKQIVDAVPQFQAILVVDARGKPIAVLAERRALRGAGFGARFDEVKLDTIVDGLAVAAQRTQNVGRETTVPCTGLDQIEGPAKVGPCV